MSEMASQITEVVIVCSIVGSGADQRKHQSFASLAFVQGIHRWPVNSPHKGPVTRKMFPFDDVIMPVPSVGPSCGVGVSTSRYHQTSNISHAFVGNKIDDHSYVVGASPVGALNSKTRWETCKFWDLVPFILEIWWRYYTCSLWASCWATSAETMGSGEKSNLGHRRIRHTRSVTSRHTSHWHLEISGRRK